MPDLVNRSRKFIIRHPHLSHLQNVANKNVQNERSCRVSQLFKVYNGNNCGKEEKHPTFSRSWVLNDILTEKLTHCLLA